MAESTGTITEYDSSTQQSTTLSIVLPVYNEAGNIDLLLEEFTETVESDELGDYHPYEIIFVDDGSSDGSREILREAAETHTNVKAILLRRNFGQSAALAAGIDSAGGDIIITMDSDMQNDPSDIPRLLTELNNGYDCVSGWRKDRQDSISKTIPSKTQTYLAWIAGPKIHDFGCTLKAYRSEAIKDINLHGEGHRYIPSHLHRRGYSVTEILVNHRPRNAGNTKYGTKRLLNGSLDLFFNAFWNRFSSRPLHFLGGIGILSATIGGVLGIHAVIIKYVFGVSLAPRTPRLILISLLVIFGIQLVLFGFLAEIMVKINYKEESPYRVKELIK
jgi:glycosyltransferase involved in cell wall biosynthesis